jgi:hypothetical protein
LHASLTAEQPQAGSERVQMVLVGSVLQQPVQVQALVREEAGAAVQLEEQERVGSVQVQEELHPGLREPFPGRASDRFQSTLNSLRFLNSGWFFDDEAKHEFAHHPTHPFIKGKRSGFIRIFSSNSRVADLCNLRKHPASLLSAAEHRDKITCSVVEGIRPLEVGADARKAFKKLKNNVFVLEVRALFTLAVCALALRG